MSYSNILAEIKSTLEGITDIGNVYDSIRWSAFSDNYLNNFIANISNQDQVRVFFITREATGIAYGPTRNALGTRISISNAQALRRHNIMIEGYQSFRDNETEVDWQTLIESILTTLSSEVTFNGTAFNRSENIDVPAIDMTFFGDIYCHHVVFQFYVTERENVSLS